MFEQSAILAAGLVEASFLSGCIRLRSKGILMKFTNLSNHNMHKSIRYICCLFLIGGVLTACSANQAYSSFQAEKRTSCYSVPAENYDACMAEANKSFKEYEQELKEYERKLKEEKKAKQDPGRR